ncbi:amidohydrolase family protein [Flavobacteriaceae bacterium R38]|nr:amidohydrolase family protein [Flavobacteriaceae bacterium R38]
MKYLIIFSLFFSLTIQSQDRFHLKAQRVFDGNEIHQNWSVHIEGEKIVYAGPTKSFRNSKLIDYGDHTILPGLIEGHSHILLHPYNETSWNDQVLKESYGERASRATNHLRASLMAGITTMRDLGSEGAGYLDVGMKISVEKGIIPGPRLLVAGPAIVATGSYGPKGFHEFVKVPLGAEEADGSNLMTVTRRQIGNGADIIKVYADYRWGPDNTARPTFSEDELRTIVETAKSSGRSTVAHASTAEAMKRAINAGVKTIEHGDEATKEVFDLMVEKGVALCPTIAAGLSISQYRGWKKGSQPEPQRVINKRKSFQLALERGVTISFGGDVGVFPHGENVLELELMTEYGMPNQEALKSATSVNAKLFGLNKLGQLKEGFLADIIIVKGNPLKNISALRNVEFVMKNGDIVKN